MGLHRQEYWSELPCSPLGDLPMSRQFAFKVLYNRVWVKRQQLELDIEKQTGFNLGKEYIEAVYCHPAYLTYIQSASCEMPGWMKHKLESRLPGEISIISDM